MRVIAFFLLLGLASVSAAGLNENVVQPWSLPVVAPVLPAASKQHVVQLPTLQAQPIIQDTIYETLDTVTQPMQGVASQPVLAPVQFLPMQVQSPIYSENPTITTQTAAVLQQQAPEVDRSTAPTQYVEPLINKQHFTQPILQPKIVTQPILQQRLIQQPIFRQHIVQQPIVRPVITQPVITPNYLEKTTIENQITEQPIIQPKVTEQTVVQPVLSEKQFTNQPITNAPIMGSKTQFGDNYGLGSASTLPSSSGPGVGQFAGASLGQPMAMAQQRRF